GPGKLTCQNAPTTTTTTTSSTTSTTVACCSIGGSPAICIWVPDASGCGVVIFGNFIAGTLGPPGSVCDSVSGDCTTTASPGNCCAIGVGGEAACVGAVDSTACTTGVSSGGLGGQFVPNAVCMPNGQCQ